MGIQLRGGSMTDKKTFFVVLMSLAILASTLHSTAAALVVTEKFRERERNVNSLTMQPHFLECVPCYQGMASAMVSCVKAAYSNSGDIDEMEKICNEAIDIAMDDCPEFC